MLLKRGLPLWKETYSSLELSFSRLKISIKLKISNLHPNSGIFLITKLLQNVSVKRFQFVLQDCSPTSLVGHKSLQDRLTALCSSRRGKSIGTNRGGSRFGYYTYTYLVNCRKALSRVFGFSKLYAYYMNCVVVWIKKEHEDRERMWLKIPCKLRWVFWLNYASTLYICLKIHFLFPWML